MGGVDKLRIKLSQLSTKVEVEVEAELGNVYVLLGMGGNSQFCLLIDQLWQT